MKKSKKFTGVRHAPNVVKIRWSGPRDSNRPFVVEVRETRRGHYAAGAFLRETYTNILVGRYCSESSANKAARRAAKKHGGNAYNIRGELIAVFDCRSRQIYVDETDPKEVTRE